MPGCDVILVNADGRVVEQGNHNELMALKGVYYKLQMQSQKWALNPTALMWQNIAHPNFLMDFEVCHKMTREGSAPLKKRGGLRPSRRKTGCARQRFPQSRLIRTWRPALKCYKSTVWDVPIVEHQTCCPIRNTCEASWGAEHVSVDVFQWVLMDQMYAFVSIWLCLKIGCTHEYSIQPK